MNRSTPGLPVHYQLLEFTQTHIHRVRDAISSSVIPLFSCLQSFPASGSFQMSQLFTSGGQSIGVSASFLPMNAAAAKSLQSCPTLRDAIDSSPPGTAIPGILQARTLEWVAISFSNAWKWKVRVKSLSHVWLLATPWAAAYQAPPSMGFSRQEYWSGVPSPSPSYMLLVFKYLNTAIGQSDKCLSWHPSSALLSGVTSGESLHSSEPEGPHP